MIAADQLVFIRAGLVWEQRREGSGGRETPSASPHPFLQAAPSKLGKFLGFTPASAEGEGGSRCGGTSKELCFIADLSKAKAHQSGSHRQKQWGETFLSLIPSSKYISPLVPLH